MAGQAVEEKGQIERVTTLKGKSGRQDDVKSITIAKKRKK